MASRIGIVSRWIVAAFLLCAGTAAHAEKRVALVIGNSAYQTVPTLPNPDADAKLMSDTLLSLGFFVVGGGAQLDLDKAGFDAALRKFEQRVDRRRRRAVLLRRPRRETHGLNYLVPVDAHPPTRAMSSRRWSTFRRSRPTREIRHQDQPGAARRLPRQSVERPAAYLRPPAASRRCRRRPAR